jgi:ABC-2 type transport system ATP-binding protein
LLAIETLSLRKAYGRKVAVANLTLRVEPGQVFGFLGPNGAGKTTSMKMLLGLARPTSGQARLLGRPLGDIETRKRVGFLPEQFRFHEWLRAGEFLEFHGKLYGMEAAHRRRRSGEVLEMVGLADRAGDQLRTFSKGMLQRIGLAQALLNQPDLVFLDEPTSGLDPLGRRLVRDVIWDLRSRGVTVFLNSHMLSEVERVCDQVAIMDRGEVVKAGRLQELLSGSTAVEIRVSGAKPELVEQLRPLCCELRSTDSLISALVDDVETVPRLAQLLVNGGARLYGISTSNESLEEVFIKLVDNSRSPS